MRILSIVHAYPPEHGSGAEWMLHALHKDLIKHGHEVKCQAHRLNNPVDFDGVKVVKEITSDDMKWADVVITHLGSTGRALNLAQRFGKPLVWIAHNTHKYGVVNVKRNGIHIVYNSHYVKGETEKHYTQHPSIIVRPPIDIDHYKVRSKRTHITLINYNDLKGGVHLAQIAGKMRDRKFLAVKGAYGDMVEDQPGNVEKMPNMADIRAAYRKTRILIMPSRYETWGRTAAEAMCSSIPVIAHPTPGLKECLGEAGRFVPFHHLPSWIEAIEEVEASYDEWSKKAILRAKEIGKQTEADLATFRDYLTSICG